jgi:thiol-disulfide isomerase/thioredoxin
VLRDLAGELVEIAELRGRVVLINLWASWCPPCRVEVPRLSRLHRDLEGDGLAVLGVNQEAMDDLRLAEVAAELGIDYRVVRVERGLGGSLRDEGVLPHTWLIDRAGRVRASHAGLPSEGSLRRACRRLLAEDPEGVEN